MVPEGTDEVTVEVTLSGQTESGEEVELAFEVAREPLYGEAEIVGNVLTYHSSRPVDDQVLLAVTDGRESNQAVVEFEFGGGAGGKAVGTCVAVE